jgi:adenylate cyclase
MNTERAKRKLSAILSADVKGYSRLMGEDEVGTVRTLKERREVMSKLIKEYRGRVVDSPGDNLLAEFASVVDAVESAIEIQRQLKAKNAEIPEKRRMEFRIGINLGDVIEEGERIYGDGVNVAARIEGLALPGGVCVSGTAYDHVENKVVADFEYMGEQAVKNIRKPVRVYRVRTERGVPDVAMKQEVTLPDEPSIAVLPFVNMSGDPKQEFFSDGITEEIITALSKVPHLFVISRESTFFYKGKPLKVKQVADDLGVRYVLEGSVQRSADRIRINAQLIDALTGRHIWAERYDRQLTDIFALQDEITMKILAAIQVKLTQGEQASSIEKHFKGEKGLDCYLKFLEGMNCLEGLNVDGTRVGRRIIEEAMEMCPENPMTFTAMGRVHGLEYWLGLEKSPQESIEKGIDFTQKALALEDSLSFAHQLLSSFYTLKGEHEKAMAEGERAVALEPGGAGSHLAYGMSLMYAGQSEEAIPVLQRAIRLNPLGESTYLLHLGHAYLTTGRFEKAVSEYKKALQRAPDNLFAHLCLTGIYFGMGIEQEARAEAAEVLRINPKFSVDAYTKRLPFRDRSAINKFSDALRKAGLPNKPPLPLPDKPSIAVLPFVNMSGDPEQEYFSDGITEEIITWLSKIPRLFVTARNSAFIFKGKSVRVREVGQQLGVRYIMEGSVRKSGDRVRVTAQLIDGNTEQHVWADRYDRELKDVFAIQDEIAMNIMVALQVQLTEGDQARLRARGTDNLEAYLKLLQAREYFHEFSKEGNILSRQKYHEAITLASDYASAYAGIALTYLVEPWHGWSDSPAESLRRSMEYAQKCISLDGSVSDAHTAVGLVYLLMRQWDKAVEECELAVSLNPNSADNIVNLAMALRSVGRVREALALLNKATRLNPMPPDWYLHEFGSCYRLMGSYDEAITMLKRVLDRNPSYLNSRLNLIATYVMSGKQESARVEALEVLRQIPNFSIDQFLKDFPYKDQKIITDLKECWLKAGLK